MAMANGFTPAYVSNGRELALSVPSLSPPSFLTISAAPLIHSWGLTCKRKFRRDVIKCDGTGVTVSSPIGTEWAQKIIEFPSFRRGCHIITKRIYNAVPEISEFEVGLANLFVMHTSASLTINENASSDVPLDMEDSLNRIVPEAFPYRHIDEGSDDMPAHVKSSLMGCSLTIPIKSGRFALGIWQGIWLNEHRDMGGPRKICITIQGVKRADGRIFK